MRRRRLAAALAVGASLAVAATACGANSGGSAIVATTAGTTTPAPSTSAAATTSTGPSTSAPIATDPGTTTPGTAVPTTVDPALTLPPKDIRLGLVEVAEIDKPTAFAVRTGDTALYIASQPGKVFAVRPGAAPALVLDISSDVKSGGEQGLIGLAFSPDGTMLFIDYTRSNDSIQVESLPVASGGAIDASARRVIINIEHPGEQNHNGGNLVFGPDHMLYIGVGDGGGAGDPERHAQNLLSLLGKILRVDVLAGDDAPYDFPKDNPFFAMSSKRNEIWAYGLRNPWRFSFDRLTGDLWIGDVGQDTIEEVNVARAGDGAGRGANFGWSAYEGTQRFNSDQAAADRIDPAYQYTHGDRSASVTGGFVYRGASIPSLYGAYVFGDEVLGTVWALRINDKGKAAVAEVGYVETLSSFGEDANGELYALSYGPGKVYRITQAPSGAAN